jgi:hypothetical protein
MIVTLLASAMSFYLAYKLMAKMVFTSTEMGAAPWVLFVAILIFNSIMDLIFNNGGAGFISLIVFLILSWKILRLNIKDAFIFSLLWGAFNFVLQLLFLNILTHF